MRGILYTVSMSGDDDDILPSFSKQEAFTRADRGKKEEVQMRAHQKFGLERDANLKEAELKSKVSLNTLRDELHTKDDADQKRKEADEKSKEQSRAPKTKTLKEKEEAQTTTAQDRPDTDTMISRQEDEKQVSDEEVQREPG